MQFDREGERESSTFEWKMFSLSHIFFDGRKLFDKFENACVIYTGNNPDSTVFYRGNLFKAEFNPINFKKMTLIANGFYKCELIE